MEAIFDYCKIKYMGNILDHWNRGGLAVPSDSVFELALFHNARRDQIENLLKIFESIIPRYLLSSCFWTFWPVTTPKTPENIQLDNLCARSLLRNGKEAKLKILDRPIFITVSALLSNLLFYSCMYFDIT